MEPRGIQRDANEAQEVPKGGPKRGKRVTEEWAKWASIGPARIPKRSKRGAQEGAEGGQDATRASGRIPKGPLK